MAVLPSFSQTLIPALGLFLLCCSSDAPSGVGDGSNITDATMPDMAGDAADDRGSTTSDATTPKDGGFDPNNCGGAGKTCKPEEQCINGSCVCAPAFKRCSGSCLAVFNDPANCGDCGKACAKGKVCVGGGCLDSCLPGLSPCDGACVDTSIDNAHCGQCNKACTGDKGCVNGSCVAAAVFPRPPKCAGGSGPPIIIDDGKDGRCAGNLAQTTFTWGVCSCSDANLSSDLLIDGFDSLVGPYVPGQLGGGLGANGQITTSSSSDVWGQLWTASVGGYNSSSRSEVHHDLQCAGPLTAASDLVLGRDAYVNGDISGKVSIVKTLTQSPGKTRSGDVSYDTLVTQPVTVSPPCNCDKKVPVAAIVAARKTNNDNAAVNLDPAIFDKAGAPARIDLQCGHYYFDRIQISTPLTIMVHGRTAIYVGSDIQTGGFININLGPNAELDMFVAGTISGASTYKVGSPHYPARTRLYIGGQSPFALSSSVVVAGNIWAGNALVTWSSTADMFGALFVGDLRVSAPLNLHHDQRIVSAGDNCPPPPGSGSSGTSDAGVNDATIKTDQGSGSWRCEGCQDCNNQACINGTCGQCTDSSQCCPPLYCVQGTCVPIIK